MLLSSPLLSDVEKHRVICVFCLKDEINNLSSSFLNSKYTDRIRLSIYYHPMLFYWNHIFSTAIERHAPCGQYEWAKKYLWNRLDNNKKINVAIALIRTSGVKYQTFIINDLTEEQQNGVFTLTAANITINYVHRAISIWKRLCTRTFLNKEQFVNVLLTLMDTRHKKLQHYIIPIA